MKDQVYKLTSPENLNHLSKEFDSLKIFYSKAKELEAFVLVSIV
jgi:hypothetical protein